MNQLFAKKHNVTSISGDPGITGAVTISHACWIRHGSFRYIYQKTIFRQSCRQKLKFHCIVDHFFDKLPSQHLGTQS